MLEETRESEKVIDDLQESVKRIKLSYADGLYDHQRSLTIQKNKDRETVGSRSQRGVSLRGFAGEGWLYSNSTNVKTTSVRKMANRLGKRKAGAAHDQLLMPQPVKVDKEVPVKKDPTHIPLEEKLQRIRDLFSLAMRMDSRIVDVRVSYSETLMERALVSSVGTRARQLVPRTRISLAVIAREAGVTDYDLATFGGTAGYEVVDAVTEQVVKDTVQGAIEQLKAITPPPGPHRVILDPGVVGTVCHESFGHGLEADQALRGRSYLKDMVGKRVASELVTMYEDPTVEGAHGSYFFDDDGTEARKNTIVENGILVSFIHDMETAASMGAPLTGNSRTQDASRRRFIRMSNTYAKPGDWKLEDMIKDMKDGILMTRWLSGMEDPLGGGMQIVSKKGHLIENGKKTKTLKSITLTGRVLEVLGNVDAVSKEGFVIDSGNCGKGAEDYVPVGSGGTWWRTKGVIG